MKNKELENYLKARKRVNHIKGFYIHLFWYALINAAIFICYFVFEWLRDIENWLVINSLLTAIPWGIGVFIHGLFVFRPKIFSKLAKRSVFSPAWKERKIREILNDEEL